MGEQTSLVGLCASVDKLHKASIYQLAGRSGMEKKNTNLVALADELLGNFSELLDLLRHDRLLEG